MAEQPKGDSLNLRLFQASSKSKITSAGFIAIFLTLLWLLGAAAFYWAAPNSDVPVSGLKKIFIGLAIIIPIIFIWTAALSLKAAKAMRLEAQDLRAELTTLRQGFVPSALNPANIEKMATFTKDAAQNAQPKQPAPSAAPKNTQKSLALNLPQNPPLSQNEIIRALHFPKNLEDKRGFQALKRALNNPELSGLTRSAQDILTLLSQNGIYVDDFFPIHVSPLIWRHFADGKRGNEVLALGGIHDENSIQKISERLRNDPVFKDTAHHFMRRFDQMLHKFVDRANDEEISRIADTRTGRAFMILGHCTGAFKTS